MKQWIVLMLVTLNACTALPLGDTTSPRTYLLETPLPHSITTKTNGKVLQVSMPRAAPGFDTAALVFIRTPHVLERYNKSQWIDTPAHMLLPLLVRHLEAAGKFTAVLSATTTSMMNGELRLDTEILRLQHEFLTNPSQVRFVLRMQLLDMTNQSILATQMFEVVEKSTSEDAAGGVLAANQAVAKILAELVDFIIEKL